MSCREAHRNSERLYYKFISQYFEGVHKEWFEEAHAFFNEVKQKYLTVKDVTKTEDFMSRVTPDLPIPYYYLKRPINRPKPPQMQLQIQLMDAQELQGAVTQEEPVATVPACVSDSDVPVATVPACVPDGDVPVATVPACVPDGDVQDLPAASIVATVPACVPDGDVQDLPAASIVATVPACVPDGDVQDLPAASMDVQDLADDETLPILPNDVYEGLMSEIHKDPDLMKILDDFPDFDDDEFESMNPSVWYDIQPNISPLEIEISNIF